MMKFIFGFAVFFLTSSVVFAAGEKSAMPQLEMSTYISQIFWLIIFFAILYLICVRKILPQYSDAIGMRAQRISSDLRQAEDNNKEAQELQKTTASDLNAAHDRAAEILRREREKLLQKMGERHAETEMAAAEQIAQAEQALLMMSQKVEKEFDVMVTSTAGQIITNVGGIKSDDDKLQDYLKKVQS